MQARANRQCAPSRSLSLSLPNTATTPPTPAFLSIHVGLTPFFFSLPPPPSLSAHFFASTPPRFICLDLAARIVVPVRPSFRRLLLPPFTSSTPSTRSDTSACHVFLACVTHNNKKKKISFKEPMNWAKPSKRKAKTSRTTVCTADVFLGYAEVMAAEAPPPDEVSLGAVLTPDAKLQR